MLVGLVKNASLFQKLTLNLIGFRVYDLSEPIRCHASLPVCLQHTRNELNLCLKQNRPDRSYRDTLLSGVASCIKSFILCKNKFSFSFVVLAPDCLAPTLDYIVM